MSRISVIIPCYNEEESIRKVLTSLPNIIDEVIVVDNNSDDNTSEIAASLGAKVIHEPRQGYGIALKTGFKQAMGDIIVTLDGDGQYPAQKIPEMIDYLNTQNIDFVSGNRFPMSRGSISGMRIVGNKMLTVAANILFGISLRDSQSGMWVFQRQILETITLESNDMPISEEIKIRTELHSKFRFREFHIPYYNRTGTSKLSPIRHGIKNMLFLFKLAMERRKQEL